MTLLSLGAEDCACLQAEKYKLKLVFVSFINVCILMYAHLFTKFCNKCNSDILCVHVRAEETPGVDRRLQLTTLNSSPA